MWYAQKHNTNLGYKSTEYNDIVSITYIYNILLYFYTFLLHVILFDTMLTLSCDAKTNYSLY